MAMATSIAYARRRTHGLEGPASQSGTRAWKCNVDGKTVNKCKICAHWQVYGNDYPLWGQCKRINDVLDGRMRSSLFAYLECTPTGDIECGTPTLETHEDFGCIEWRRAKS